jgi:hypothetical protein
MLYPRSLICVSSAVKTSYYLTSGIYTCTVHVYHMYIYITTNVFTHQKLAVNSNKGVLICN